MTAKSAKPERVRGDDFERGARGAGTHASGTLRDISDRGIVLTAAARS